ncbi:MAG: DNA topoisomerase, partial [Patescibacteria group bacterium]
GKKQKYVFRANGNVLRFDGFLKIWLMKFTETDLPPLATGEDLKCREVNPEQHFTEPPPRYNEASLIKTLEQNGIGRPSTYAPIISVIQERNYVEKNQGRFFPTEIGTLVNKVLTENFSEIVDIGFTAKMEQELDEIADGRIQWSKVIREFYEPFSQHLTKMYETVSKEKLIDETTDEKCEKCGKPMIIKFGRFGKFMACSGFPDCKNTKTLKEPPKSTGLKCPKCLASPDSAKRNEPGEIIERRVNKKGRAHGKIFWGCNRYPACDYASWQDPLKFPPIWPPIEGEKTASGKKRGVGE